MAASQNHQKVIDNFVDTLTDPFTNNVIDAMGEITPPRQREIFTSLIRHLHAFARDVNLLTPGTYPPRASPRPYPTPH